jgi:4-hydroxy-tetrahydrodipicolinate synthase
MHTTRRSFLGSVGTAAAVAAVPAANGAGKAAGKPLAPAATKQLYYVAAPTPCDKSLKFDDGLYKDMLAYYKEKGADGIVVLGTTGEFPSFSAPERRKVAETALKHRNGLRIIVQPGTSNEPETVELSTHAEANGADGLLVIPPFYYKNPPLDGLIRYYSAVFDAVKIPVHLYHIPGTSAVPITHELLHAMEKYPHLSGIKDSTGDAAGYQKFVETFPKLNMMSGTENNLKPALLGGMGAILAGGVFVGETAAVFAAHRAGQDLDAPLAKLRAASQLLRPGGIGSYGPMKFALAQRMGSRQAFQRPPFVDVTDEQKSVIVAKLAELKQLQA